MFEIKINNRYSYLQNFERWPEKLKNELFRMNSYFVENAEKSKKFQEGKWDGRKYFLTAKGRLSSGLLSGTLEVLKKEKVTCKTIKHRLLPGRKHRRKNGTSK